VAGRIVLGGTFDRLHVGHEALLGAAFRTGRPVAIGLTSERFLELHPKPSADTIQPYAARRRTLRRWLAAHYPPSRWTIVPISDAFGGSVGPDVAGLVVSADTVEGGRAVNAERVRRGRRPVPVQVVPLVLGDDLEPVSSRRIRAGEIDRSGRRRSAIAIRVEAPSGPVRSATERAIRRTFPRARIQRRVDAVRGRPPHRAPELVVTVRGAGARWRVTVASARIRLRAERIRADTPRALGRALETLLRRSRGRTA
jgi:phosphopantetheine adenylyltransferase